MTLMKRRSWMAALALALSAPAALAQAEGEVITKQLELELVILVHHHIGITGGQVEAEQGVAIGGVQLFPVAGGAGWQGHCHSGDGG